MILIGKERTQLLKDLQDSDIGNYKSTQLREIASKLGVSRAKADVMRVNIQNVIDTELGVREHIEAESPTISKPTLLQTTINKFYEALEQKDYYLSITELGFRFFQTLQASGASYNTIKGYKTDLRNAFIERVSETHPHVEFKRKEGIFESTDESLDRKLNQVLRVIRQAKTEEYSEAIFETKRKNIEKLKGYGGENIPVDFTELTPFLIKVENLLDSGNTRKTDWKDIVTYLAIVTGRRTCELLCGYTEFTIVDTHRVIFKGQAKDKGQKESEPYTIYVLSHSSYVEKAMAWLDNHGKRTEPSDTTPEALRDCREKINNRTSGQLNKNLKLISASWNLEKPTMHQLRKVYACTLKALKPSLFPNKNENVFLGEMLGHGVVNDEGKFITDGTTTEAYSIYVISNPPNVR